MGCVEATGSDCLVCNFYVSVAAPGFNQTNIGTVSRATLGRRLREGGARMGLSERYDAHLS